MIDQNQKKAPSDIQAEQSVLGAILFSKDALTAAIENLKAEAFYLEKHKTIFHTMLNLFETTEAIDIVSLTNQLKKDKNLTSIGGALYLRELMDLPTSPANVEYHCNLINDKHILRQLINVSSEIINDAYSESFDASEILENAESKIFSIAESRLKEGFTHINELLIEPMTDLDNLIKHQTPKGTISSDFSDLDNILTGFQQSNLIILAARPSMGKTAFSLKLALNAAINQKKTIGIFTLEMASSDLIKRLLANVGHVDISSLKRGIVRDKQSISKKLSEANIKLANAPIFIDDSPKINVLEMRAKARRLQKEYGLDMLIIDYLQLMDSYSNKKSFSREQEVSQISRSLKGLAKELKIPILALAQLSRSPEQRTDKKPRLSDLRESGSIEQDADVVMFLYSDDYYADKEEEQTDTIKVIVSKHRNGETGAISLVFLKEYQDFVLESKDSHEF